MQAERLDPKFYQKLENFAQFRSSALSTFVGILEKSFDLRKF